MALQTPLDVNAAAEILGCSHWTVREMIKRGELGHVRLGRLIRIPRHELAAFLDLALEDLNKALADAS